jgi:hypothetical protein
MPPFRAAMTSGAFMATVAQTVAQIRLFCASLR